MRFFLFLEKTIINYISKHNGRHKQVSSDTIRFPKKANSLFSNCLCFSFSKRGQVHSPSYASFILQANKTHIHTNYTKACAPGLVLKRRLKTNFKSVCYLTQFIINRSQHFFFVQSAKRRKTLSYELIASRNITFTFLLLSRNSESIMKCWIVLKHT